MKNNWTKTVIWIFVLWGLAPFIVVSVQSLVKIGGKDKQKNQQTMKVPQRVYDKFFDEDFLVEVTPDKKKYRKKRLLFMKNGMAVLQHDHNFKPVYDFFIYKPMGTTIQLKGERTLTIGNNIHVSDNVPEDIVLEVVQNDEKILFKGYSPNTQKKYQLSKITGSFKFSISKRLIETAQFCQSQYLNHPENLWEVQDNYIPITIEKNSNKAYKFVNKGELLFGEVDKENPDYIHLHYDGKLNLYIDALMVKKVGNQQRLSQLLAENGERGTTLMQWEDSLNKIEWNAATQNYFNGWKAGRMAVIFFFFFIGWLLFILLLDRTYGWFSELWPYVSKITIVLLTLTELWYAGSLGIDALWFFTDISPIAFVVCIALASILFSLQLILIYSVESDLELETDTYSTIPKWIEYILALILGIGSIPLVIVAGSISPFLGILLFYGALILALLPTIISLHRHSNKLTPIVWFYMLCMPMRYVLIVWNLLITMFYEINKRGRNISSDPSRSSDYEQVTNMHGDTVNLHKMPNGDWLDDNGNSYTHSNGGFHRNGIDNKDGSFYK